MQKKILTMLLLLIAFITLSMAKKEALIVVVSDYGNGKGSRGTKYDLDGVIHDMYNMQNLLEKKWGFKVEILRDKNSLKLGRTLDKYAERLSEKDDFVLYFSGHGSQVEDKSGDEKDKKDETLVLSDGKINSDFLDDELYAYLNEIKARKMLILDSCHSGTAFRVFDDKPIPKALSSKEIDGGVLVTRKVKREESTLSDNQDYIVFSASEDNEKSLATKKGSLFTLALTEAFSKGAVYEKLVNLKEKINQKIAQKCRETNSEVHHSYLSASDKALTYNSVRNYFHSDTQVISDKKGISIKSKKRFDEGEVLSFDINTHQHKGYITLFVIQNSKALTLYQSHRPYQGKLNYPSSFSTPKLYAELGCGSECTEQSNMFYLLISATSVASMKQIGEGQFKFSDANGVTVTPKAIQHFKIDVYERLQNKKEQK